MNEIKEISLEDIKALAKTLKKFSKTWLEDMVKLINEKHGKGTVDSYKIYNIMNNQVKHQSFRIMFVEASEVLLQGITITQNAAAETVSNILANNSEKEVA